MVVVELDGSGMVVVAAVLDDLATVVVDVADVVGDFVTVGLTALVVGAGAFVGEDPRDAVEAVV